MGYLTKKKKKLNLRYKFGQRDAHAVQLMQSLRHEFYCFFLHSKGTEKLADGKILITIQRRMQIGTAFLERDSKRIPSLSTD
jgi:hypothetical protein